MQAHANCVFPVGSRMRDPRALASTIFNSRYSGLYNRLSCVLSHIIPRSDFILEKFYLEVASRMDYERNQKTSRSRRRDDISGIYLYPRLSEQSR